MIRTTYYCPACQCAWSTSWPFGSHCDCGCEKIEEILVRAFPQGDPQYRAVFVYDEHGEIDGQGASRSAAIQNLIAQVR